MDKLIEKLKNRKVVTIFVIALLLIACLIFLFWYMRKPSPDGPTGYSVSGPIYGVGTTDVSAGNNSLSDLGVGNVDINSVTGFTTDQNGDAGSTDIQDGADSSGDHLDVLSDISGNTEEVTPADDPLNTDPQTPSDPIDAYIASMTLHEKVCQMIIATPSSLTGERKPKSAGILLQNALSAYPVGGLIFDGGNISGSEQLKKFLSDAQSYSEIPLILTLDEEGGRVTRLQNTVGTTHIGPMYEYHDQGAGIAFTNAMVIAIDIKSYGFNMDLAPVADVWSNPANTVIGDRAYSTDYNEASELVSSAVLGFHSQGIPCCLKHFPGHGDSSEDSHYGAVYVYKPLADIKAEECLPFSAGINAGADCVMMGHLIVSELGDDPALFSQTLIQGVLRGELGFNGIVMTDSLQMKAMTDYYGVSDIAVRSVTAGCDILLMPSDVPFTVKAIEDGVAAGTISESRIDESVHRIIALKVKYGIMEL